MELINPAWQPTVIAQPSDATALVPLPPGGSPDPLTVATIESQTRISAGTTPQSGSSDTAAFTGALSMPGAQPGVQLYADGASDAQLKNQVRCAYVKAANTVNTFGDPTSLDATKDPIIQAMMTSTGLTFMDRDFAKTATVMKMVLHGFAGAGTITMGGYDYHDGTRATGESRNFKAGQMIGMVLQYASAVGQPVMIYVFSDGSLNANSMLDTSAAGRGKLGWQGDNSSVASTFFLAYSPKGRPTLRGAPLAQQIGAFTPDGNVVSTSSPAANSVDSLVYTLLLNYMGLSGTDSQFAATFPMQSLGGASQLGPLTVFNPIV